MNWFKEMFDRQDKNIYYKKIEKLLRKQGLSHNMIEAYMLGGSVYSLENYDKALIAIKQNTFKNFLDTIAFDTQKDNMEFYLINYKSEKSKLIIVYDPFELYEPERILKILPYCEDLNAQGISTEKIYP